MVHVVKRPQVGQDTLPTLQAGFEEGNIWRIHHQTDPEIGSS